MPGEPTPDEPIIPFIEGDEIGADITPVMKDVVDAAVAKAYGSDTWLPDETLEAAREYSVSIKGPLTTPVGGGIRSLTVTLRQQLGLSTRGSSGRPGATRPAS